MLMLNQKGHLGMISLNSLTQYKSVLLLCWGHSARRHSGGYKNACKELPASVELSEHVNALLS